MRSHSAAGVLAVAGAAILGGCSSTPSRMTTPEVVSVSYEGEFHMDPAMAQAMGVPADTGIADITATTPTGIKQQGADLPITSKADGSTGVKFQFAPGAPVGLSIQNKRDAGEVTCRIRGSDGSVISENTSSGTYAIASCNGVAR